MSTAYHMFVNIRNMITIADTITATIDTIVIIIIIAAPRLNENGNVNLVSLHPLIPNKNGSTCHKHSDGRS